MDYQYDEEEPPVAAEAFATQAVAEDPSLADWNSWQEAVSALTVTSKRLAEVAKARGYYQPSNDKGKGKGSSGNKGKNKSKGKGKSKGPKGKGKSSFKGNSKGSVPSSSSLSKGKGKPSPTPSQANLAQQQQRLQDSACLTCGSLNHWMKDCPHVSKYSAQMATAGSILDPEGHVVSSWMVSSSTSSENAEVRLPELAEDLKSMGDEKDLLPECVLDKLEVVDGIPSNPRILLQYISDDAGYMIADTGCQRQVAGRIWHEQRAREVCPLEVLKSHEACHFSFGPNKGIPSTARFVYPAGLGGCAVALGISQVDVKAPALFSRPSFTSLGAVPNIVTGIMHYVALNTESELCLSPCGHLAIRIDEWPSHNFAWPPALDLSSVPDAWSASAAVLNAVKLKSTQRSFRPPPHAEGTSELGTAMASTLAAAASACDGVCVQRLSNGADLLSSEHETLLKDMALKVFFPKQMATTVLSSMAALTMQSQSNQLGYVNRPEDCEHPSGLRSYGAGGYRMKICDLCGSRWAHLGQGGELQKCQPKATPTAKTPLGVLTPKSKAKSQASSASSGYSPPPSRHFLQQGSLMKGPTYKAPPLPKAKSRLARQGIYEKQVTEMTQEELLNLHHRWEDMMMRNHLRQDYDFENGEADPDILHPYQEDWEREPEDWEMHSQTHSQQDGDWWNQDQAPQYSFPNDASQIPVPQD